MIITCIDDMCIGAGECMHGDGEDICPVCEGEPYEGEEEWEPPRYGSPSTAKESEKGQKCHRHGIDVMNCVACDYPCIRAPRSTGETE